MKLDSIFVCTSNFFFKSYIFLVSLEKRSNRNCLFFVNLFLFFSHGGRPRAGHRSVRSGALRQNPGHSRRGRRRHQGCWIHYEGRSFDEIFISTLIACKPQWVIYCPRHSREIQDRIRYISLFSDYLTNFWGFKIVASFVMGKMLPIDWNEGGEISW